MQLHARFRHYVKYPPAQRFPLPLFVHSLHSLHFYALIILLSVPVGSPISLALSPIYGDVLSFLVFFFSVDKAWLKVELLLTIYINSSLRATPAPFHDHAEQLPDRAAVANCGMDDSLGNVLAVHA